MRYRRDMLCTYIIMILCTCIYILSKILSVSSSNSSEIAILLGCYYKPFIMAGEWWRLLTVGFVHIQLFHLFFNMTALYALGSALEPRIGHWKFLLILLVSVIGGSLWIFINDGNVVTVGLSAGLYGLMACDIMIVLLNGGMYDPLIRNSILRTVLLNLCINFIPGVSYSGHIGGAITGLLCGLIVLDEPSLRNYRKHACICITIFACTMGYMVKQRSYIPAGEVYKGTDYHILQKYQSMHLDGHAEKIAENLDAIYGDNDMTTILKGDQNGQKVY